MNKIKIWLQKRHSKKKIDFEIPRHCFFCYNFTLFEFTEEDIRLCAENWLDAKNCPNWKPLIVWIRNKTINIIGK